MIPASSAGLTAMRNSEQGPVRILLVEDNAGDVFLLREALARSDLSHELTVLEDGAVAIDFLRQRGKYVGKELPDLVLLDLNLPRVDGAVVLSLFHEIPSLQKIPVVILSSSQSPRDAMLGATLPRSMYLHKPSDLDEFLDLGMVIRRFWQKVHQQ